MMKKFLFIVGPEWAGKYDSSKELISKNHLNDIMLFDIKLFLQRKYYVDKINLKYTTWLEALKQTDINDMISCELIKRISNNDNINNVILTGCTSYDDICYIADNLKIKDYSILFVDATRELLYRNYTIKGGKNITFEQFNSIVDEMYNSGLDTIVKVVKKDKNQFSCFYRENNLDTLEKVIAEYFGYRFIKYPTNSQENYQWPVKPQYISLEHDRYGMRPVHMILGKSKFHSGFDIITETLTPVHASIGGIVVSSGLDEKIFSGQSRWNERYGNMIEVVDNYGRKQIYAHLRETLVNEGDIISQNEVIGLSGCSGGARVPHLHFEIRKINTEHSGENNTIDPLILLPEFDFNSLNKHFQEKPYDDIWEKMLIDPWGVVDEDIPYANSKKLIR